MLAVFRALDSIVEGKEMPTCWDFATAAICLWKVAEYELKERFLGMLDHFEYSCFRTGPHHVYHTSRAEKITLGTIGFALFRHTQAHAIRQGWQHPEEYVDAELWSEAWRSPLLKNALEEIPKLRNKYAHTERMEQTHYCELRAIVWDGQNALVDWIDRLYDTGNQEAGN